MKLELLKSRVLKNFIESCGNNLNYEIKAEDLINLLKEKNLILSNTGEKRSLSMAVIEEIPNLIIGLSRARTKLISVEGYRLKDSRSFQNDIEKHLPYLHNFKALSA